MLTDNCANIATYENNKNVYSENLLAVKPRAANAEDPTIEKNKEIPASKKGGDASSDALEPAIDNFGFELAVLVAIFLTLMLIIRILMIKITERRRGG